MQVCALLLTSDAMEMLLMAYLGPALRCEWGIEKGSDAMISISVFFGAMLGSLIWGQASPTPLYPLCPRHALCSDPPHPSIGTDFGSCLTQTVPPSRLWLILHRGPPLVIRRQLVHDVPFPRYSVINSCAGAVWCGSVHISPPFHRHFTAISPPFRLNFASISPPCCLAGTLILACCRPFLQV